MFHASISDCLRLDKKGNVEIDASKLDPSAVRITGKRTMNLTDTEQKKVAKNRIRIENLKDIFRKNTDNVSIITKSKKLFRNTHYLIVISKKEITSSELNQIQNDTLEEFEVIYYIDIRSFSTDQDMNKRFELMENECAKFFDVRDSAEVAKYILDNIRPLRGSDDPQNIQKITLPVKINLGNEALTYYEEQHGIVFIYERAVIAIQRLIANRKFVIAYQAFQAFLNSSEKIIEKTLLRIQHSYFHACVISDQPPNIPSKNDNIGVFMIYFWNVKDYNRSEVVISDAMKKYRNDWRIVLEVVFGSLY